MHEVEREIERRTTAGGQVLTYERKKMVRDIGLEHQSLTLAMTRVKTDQRKVDNMEVKLTQRADKLLRQAGSIEQDRAKVNHAKKVAVFTLSFSLLLFPV